ncbi:cold shock domain-containing protein [Streptomyces monashensis]|uniref:cold shock domain-containing protein n=1 Tax=Streptomyces monashensis TaxID=1678012 RepID=UPI001FEC0D7A|nr:cold shock domain-containing protein [Streptomyces monashensis]
MKWFDREHGWGLIARRVGGDVVARYSEFRGAANRELVAGQQVCPDVTSDTAGERAENISRPAPASCEPAESTETDSGGLECPEWPVQTMPGGSAVDTCPWCVHMRQADAANR